MKQSKFYQIKNITEHEYILVGSDGSVITRPIQDVDKSASVFTIQDAKDGDVLYCKSDNNIEYIVMSKGINEHGVIDSYFRYNSSVGFGVDVPSVLSAKNDNITPATKEQRDLLFSKMHEAGYEWNAEKKELKKIDNEEINGEDYGIDGLYHAQRILEKTLGEVDGYQTDDGILDHKAAITAVKKLYEQKSATWSVGDENVLEDIEEAIINYWHGDTQDILLNWLESLKQRIGG